MLPIGLLLYSISLNFCACIFTWCCSTRTELLQKWSLLVRIRTIVERISICFFEPGDLRFRPDSGQMEEDLVAVQHVQLNQIIFALEDLLEQHAQPEAKLILSFFSWRWGWDMWLYYWKLALRIEIVAYSINYFMKYHIWHLLHSHSDHELPHSSLLKFISWLPW